LGPKGETIPPVNDPEGMGITRNVIGIAVPTHGTALSGPDTTIRSIGGVTVVARSDDVGTYGPKGLTTVISTKRDIYPINAIGTSRMPNTAASEASAATGTRLPIEASDVIYLEQGPVSRTVHNPISLTHTIATTNERTFGPAVSTLRDIGPSVYGDGCQMTPRSFGTTVQHGLAVTRYQPNTAAITRLQDQIGGRDVPDTIPSMATRATSLGPNPGQNVSKGLNNTNKSNKDAAITQLYTDTNAPSTMSMRQFGTEVLVNARTPTEARLRVELEKMNETQRQRELRGIKSDDGTAKNVQYEYQYQYPYPETLPKSQTYGANSFIPSGVSTSGFGAGSTKTQQQVTSPTQRQGTLKAGTTNKQDQSGQYGSQQGDKIQKGGLTITAPTLMVNKPLSETGVGSLTLSEQDKGASGTTGSSTYKRIVEMAGDVGDTQKLAALQSWKDQFAKCEWCGRQFEFERLPLHLLGCPHRPRGVAVTKPASAVKSAASPELFVCPICKKEFGTLSIERHLQSCYANFKAENAKISDPWKRKPEPNLELICQEIDRIKQDQTITDGETIEQREAQMQTFNGMLAKCEWCGLTVDSKLLQQHLKTCNSRPRGNTTARDFTQTGLIPPDTDGFACGICGKIFHRDHIEMHLRGCYQQHVSEQAHVPKPYQRPVPQLNTLIAELHAKY
ncbi:MAG: hypothetical protein EZS28_014674, partial [Streblomastix strix]